MIFFFFIDFFKLTSSLPFSRDPLYIYLFECSLLILPFQRVVNHFSTINSIWEISFWILYLKSPDIQQMAYIGINNDVIGLVRVKNKNSRLNLVIWGQNIYHFGYLLLSICDSPMSLVSKMGSMTSQFSTVLVLSRSSWG